jgi:hypothetical protein
MGVPKEVMLLVDRVRFTEAPGLWWNERPRVEDLFGLVRDAGLWLDFDHYGRRGGGRPKAARTPAELARAVASLKPGLYSVQAGKSEEPECELVLTLAPGALALRFLLRGPALDARRGSIVGQLVGLARLLHDSWHDSALFGPQLCVRVHGVEFPHVRPPRHKPPWVFGNAADMLCLKFHEETDEGSPRDVGRMLKAPMPGGTRREREGDFVTLLWAADLSDPKKAAARLSTQEQWFVNVLKPPLHPSYNEHGDFREAPLSLTKRPPLTFYDPVEEIGYKAVAPAPGGKLDDEQWDEIKAWLAAGQLPDETPLQQLNLIVPSRKAALGLRKRAAAAGIENVFYTDDDGKLWNPFPPGPWLE